MSTLETREKAPIDEWQTEMLLKALKVRRVQLYITGLNEKVLKDVYVEPVPPVEEAVMARMTAQDDFEIAVVPEGRTLSHFLITY
jgi:hypothetical protein